MGGELAQKREREREKKSNYF